MKTYYECLPCLLRQTIEATKMVNETPETQEMILRCVLSEMSKMDLNKTPPHMAHFIHQYIKKATQIDDPYRALKKEFNQLSLDMSGEMRNIIQDSVNHFETAVKIAIAGNIIDFGPRADITYQEVRNTVQDCIDQPLRFNGAEELKKAIQESSRILYLGDNAGEIVFDHLLLELVPTDNITYVVKGEPIINDATMEDAMETGLCDLLRVIDNGSDAPGTILETCSTAFQKEFERSDLIIAKGQANYETLSQISGKKIFFLLKVKCPVIAYDLDCESGDLVLKRIGETRSADRD
jgi:uncharacterized protein with ATP-grasp and redox domains